MYYLLISSVNVFIYIYVEYVHLYIYILHQKEGREKDVQEAGRLPAAVAPEQGQDR